jgi:hypothetical protein
MLCLAHGEEAEKYLLQRKQRASGWCELAARRQRMALWSRLFLDEGRLARTSLTAKRNWGGTAV